MGMCSAEELVREVSEKLGEMSRTDVERAADGLRRLIEAELFGLAEERVERTCQACGSKAVIHYGRTAAGTQRFSCKECGKTFVEKGRLLKNTKLETWQWMRFAKCFVRQDVLRTISDECEVSMNTAWFMRFRMMELVKDKLPSFEIKAGVRIQADEIYMEESYKGNQKKAGFTMPRAPYRHGSKSHPAGMHYGRFCILTGVNDLGDMFYDIACRGPFTSDVARETLKRNVGKGAIMVTDNLGSYVRVLREMGLEHEAHPAEDHGPLNKVNNLHMSMRRFMRIFNGVSTKYLDLYLGYFKWLDSYCRSSESTDHTRNAALQIKVGNYQHVRREIRGMRRPFCNELGLPTLS